MRERWLLVILVLFALPALPFTDAKVYTDEPAVCGNGICQGGQGELTSCPQDCEGQTCSPGKDCLADPCTIPADPVAGFCVYPPGQPSGTCQFQLDISCMLCLNDGKSKWYGAWGDYACRLSGFTTGSSCVSNLAPLSVADFTVNSCDGTENCCASGQSSCIGNDQCGQWNEAVQQITDKAGNAYAGGTAGFCREKCTAAEVGSCRFVAGVGQKCVACSYRPDKLWKKDFPTAEVWSVTYVSSGVWVDDTSCVALPACTSGNGGCLSSVTNAATKPGACAVSLTCGDCNAGYYFDAGTSACKPTCTTLRNAAAGGCTSTFTLTDSNDLGKADCNAVATDKCVSCKAGYVWDNAGRKCVLGCKAEAAVCGASTDCCQFNTNVPPREMYCSKGLDGKSVQGNCCPKGQYWDPLLGRCEDPNVCGLLCPLPVKLNNVANPDYFSQANQDACVRLTPKPFEEACVENPNLGISLRIFQVINVLDTAGNRVSSAPAF